METAEKQELEVIAETPKSITLTVEVLPSGEAVLPVKDAEGRIIKYSTDTGSDLEPVKKAFSPYIPGPPTDRESLYKQACANDDITINSWKNQWINQTRANNTKYDFKKNSVLAVAGSEALKPAIIAGSGPSLRKNAHFLKPNWTKRIYPAPIGAKWEMFGGKQQIKIVSCLHNFSFFEDLGVMTPDDFYITLDAGDITIREIYEGGSHSEDWYWGRTKDRTLLAHTTTNPKLLEKWQGRILWYATPPNPLIAEPLKDVLDFAHIPPFNVGGNVLGAALYMARAILGAGTVISIGADFCFSRERKFHGWDSQYDKQFSGVMPATDIFGDRAYTWGSYYNFKSWFDYIACGGASNTSHNWINCTEGGILGAYPGGNIQQIQQAPLRDTLISLNMYLDLHSSMNSGDGIPRLLF